MLIISIPTSALERLPAGVAVKINREPVTIRRAGEYLLWNDQRRRIIGSLKRVDANGTACTTFFAQDAASNEPISVFC